MLQHQQLIQMKFLRERIILMKRFEGPQSNLKHVFLKLPY